jgi:hypothetical protein
MAWQEKQLGQALAIVAPTSIYSPTSGTTIITSIVVCNYSSSADAFSIYLDDDGTTYTDTTALYRDVAIPANTTIQIDCHWGMNNTSGNLAIDAVTASRITVTVFGVEIT